ncbi:uncharacterized protein LOC131335711 isoform X2 [Rhododendron vialii]|uniref:uncharacterized protein LOC131335711 isoform X2 n=1 Tax=Rhododendron vialii TaxID=182163 RepID=UPI00265EE81F|nr:uncharacterized protein LOC131335711 isoform X2 [Rhododendron vialii]
MGYGLAYQTYCEYYGSGPPGEFDHEAPCFVCWYDSTTPVRKCVGSHRDGIPKIGIHDSCAELPSKLNRHPFHRKHTLTLRTKTSCDSWTRLCDACGKLIAWGFYFFCELCNFHLDPHCATSLHRYDRGGIRNLKHPHQLMRCKMDSLASELRCSGCKTRIYRSDVYVCLLCKCLLHRRCADASPVHPFHSQHPLTLRLTTSASEYRCNVCGKDLQYGHFFHCSQCNFSLDPDCFVIMPMQSCRDGMELQTLPLNHPHPLIICEKTKNIEVICHGCKQSCKGSFYVCLHCRCILDKSCAKWPQQIDHPFHPNHPLTLLVKHDHDSSRCNACGKELQGLIFYCSECEFGLDLLCAALMPPRIKHLQLGHPHRLNLHENTENSNFICYACQLRINDSFYLCLECNIFLHRSCANLPRNVHRLPHHKHASPCQHRTLTLQDHFPHNKQFVYLPEMHPLHPNYNGDIAQQAVVPTPSKACSKCFSSKGFGYECSECLDYFDISYTLKKSKPHEHPLAYFNIKSNKLNCESCRRSLLTPFFRCEECNFNIHVSCVSILPQIVKHRCHRHILSLTYSPVKDFPDEGENAEYLFDPTYYCEECHFVSHVHCAIATSEEMRILMEEWPMAFNLEEIKLGMSSNTGKKNADKQKGPALESLASVDEATGVSVEECKAEGRVAENRLLIIKQDEDIAVLLEEILCQETKLSAMHERKEELKRRRATNFGLTRTEGIMSERISEQTQCSASESSSSENEQWITASSSSETEW